MSRSSQTFRERVEHYDRENREIAAQVVLRPENYFPGLVAWAELVQAKERAEFRLEPCE